jgi:hypothetical protein
MKEGTHVKAAREIPCHINLMGSQQPEKTGDRYEGLVGD